MMNIKFSIENKGFDRDIGGPIKKGRTSENRKGCRKPQGTNNYSYGSQGLSTVPEGDRNTPTRKGFPEKECLSTDV